MKDTYFADAQGRRQDEIQGSERVVLTITGRALEAVDRPIIGFILRDAAGQNLFGDNSYLACRDRWSRLSPGDRFRCELTFRMPYLPLGTYSIAPSIIDGTQQDHVQLHWIEEAVILTVHEAPLHFGYVGVPTTGAVTIRAVSQAAAFTEMADDAHV